MVHLEPHTLAAQDTYVVDEIKKTWLPPLLHRLDGVDIGLDPGDGADGGGSLTDFS